MKLCQEKLTEARVDSKVDKQTQLDSMSEEHLKAFLEAVGTDQGLRERLRAAGNVDDVVAIAKAAGFVISSEELKSIQSELSDEELESVTGGTWGSLSPGCFQMTILCETRGCR